MIQTDLTALMTLLCGAKEREKKNQTDSTERLNPYLVYRVVLPFLTGQDIFLEDICYEEFELEDIWPVADFFYYNWPGSYRSIRQRAASPTCRDICFGCRTMTIILTSGITS